MACIYKPTVFEKIARYWECRDELMLETYDRAVCSGMRNRVAVPTTAQERSMIEANARFVRANTRLVYKRFQVPAEVVRDARKMAQEIGFEELGREGFLDALRKEFEEAIKELQGGD
jgi:hypothetical protein